MIRRIHWLAPAGELVLLWHECGQDGTVFCYRITRGAAIWVRSRAAELAASF